MEKIIKKKKIIFFFEPFSEISFNKAINFCSFIVKIDSKSVDLNKFFSIKVCCKDSGIIAFPTTGESM